MNDMSAKRWVKGFLTLVVSGILTCVLLVATIDPYFHFHAPLKNLAYYLDNGRYINDGIGRNFEYDAIIIGSSMTKNFKTSEFDELFDTSAVKTPYSGANFSEISKALERVFARKPDCNTVLWCLDYNQLGGNREAYESYPEYLYDDNYLNDIKYLLNKNSLIQAGMTILYTLQGNETMTMDEYSAWSQPVGKSVVMGDAKLVPAVPSTGNLSEKETAETQKILEDSVLPVIKQHPNVKFYIFFSPYSIAYWDSLYRSGEVEKQIEREFIAESALCEFENVEVYSFFEDIDLITDFDNYYDAGHYAANVNSLILKRISQKKGLITKDNVGTHIAKMKEVFETFDYDSLYVNAGQ